MRRRVARPGMALFAVGVVLALVVGIGSDWSRPAVAAPSISLQQVVGGLDGPLGVVHAGNGSGRLFVVQRAGKIAIYDGTQVLPTPFLDISTLVSTLSDEGGLLGLAFHPNYASNGFFYVDYVNADNTIVVARYHVPAPTPNAADPNSAFTVLTVQPDIDHYSGQLQFGPDGYLYIAVGDGGQHGDPLNRAQSLDVLMGKILRIDVDGGSPYAIPPTRPRACPFRRVADPARPGCSSPSTTIT